MDPHEATVLVVEDNALIRMGAVDNLVTAGFGVLEASNADEAIRILEGRPDIHLVFTDVEMPGSMDGLKLAHYIRGRWPPVRLIVVSGKRILDESHLPAEAKFFPKPYDEGAILETIIRMLSELNREHHPPMKNRVGFVPEG
jgi:CheY-like chemotaxis protein